MQIDFSTYKDKVKACWIGKNIGGTLGTPYEGIKETIDVKGFVTEKNVALPNDDLDMQLVWLVALEHLSPMQINASALGDFWLGYIHPNWNEYGVSKANMRREIAPPMSGDVSNAWKNSNGAWIRTEIWACVSPGVPEMAVKMSIEDAKVDHGAGEGTIAAAFVSAMQSSAFVLNDIKECIEVGLSAIPESSRVYKSVKLAIDCYNSGKTYRQARDLIFNQNIDMSDGWFEAPSNVAYAVIGLLYGEGDFKKSLIYAINCGDDTDCTGATVGATLGILYGMKGLPNDWVEHVGDNIETITIMKGGLAKVGWDLIPKTCSELTERVVALAPSVLYRYNVEFGNRQFRKNFMTIGDKTDIEKDVYQKLISIVTERVKPIVSEIKPYQLFAETTTFNITATLSTPYISDSGEVDIDIKFQHKYFSEDMQHPLLLRWIMPDGFKIKGKNSIILDKTTSRGSNTAYESYKIIAGENLSALNKIVLEVSISGRHSSLYLPIVLIG